MFHSLEIGEGFPDVFFGDAGKVCQDGADCQGQCKNMGEFILEFIDINDIIEMKINMVPDKVRMSFIECTKSLNKMINDINSSDYLYAKSITIEE